MTASDQGRSPAAPAVIVEPDAHGQAALMLTESLLHMLVERGALTNEQAIEVVAIAAEVKEEVATAAGESNKRMTESLNLLEKMQGSFESDRRELHPALHEVIVTDPS